MINANKLFAAALIVGLAGISQTAEAQPGQPAGYQPPAPARHSTAPYRFGLTVGGELGLGSMTAESGPIICDGCDVEPIAVSGAVEIGAMINPRLAILFHLRATGLALDADGTNILWNSMGLVAAKYWINRQLWIKGGLGFAALGITYDDGFVAEDEQLDEGGAGLIGIGYEVLQLATLRHRSRPHPRPRACSTSTLTTPSTPGRYRSAPAGSKAVSDAVRSRGRTAHPRTAKRRNFA